MTPRCCFETLSLPLILDTSVAINLAATGFAAEIVRAIPNDIVITEEVQDELGEGAGPGQEDFAVDLVRADLLKIAALGEGGLVTFESLVSGSAASTLDDGEAATIALAAQNGGVPLIDERKATRICSRMFPHLIVGSTVDVFAHSRVQDALGQDRLVEAVFNALRRARMSVQCDYLDWVVSLLGTRAEQCTSLPPAFDNGRGISG